MHIPLSTIIKAFKDRGDSEQFLAIWKTLEKI